jgi:hypothetical protein
MANELLPEMRWGEEGRKAGKKDEEVEVKADYSYLYFLDKVKIGAKPE